MNQHESNRSPNDLAVVAPRTGGLVEIPRPKAGANPRPPFVLHSARELMDRVPAPWLVGGLIRARQFAVLHGPYGTGKSFVAVALGVAIATGRLFFGARTRCGVVVYAAGEGIDGLGKRVRAAIQRGDMPATGEPPTDFYGIDGVPNLGDPESVAAFIEAIRSETNGRNVVLVVLDTWSRTIAGLEENSASEVSIAVESVKAIQVGLGCAVLALHHDKKGLSGEERGSGALGGGADVMISLKLETGGAKDSPIVVNVHKTKDDAQPEPARFVRVEADLGPSRDPDAEPAARETSCFLEKLAEGLRPALRPGLHDECEQAIVEHLEALPPGERQTAAQLFVAVKRTRMNRTAIYARLRALHGRGLIEIERKGRTSYYWVRDRA